MNSIYNIYNVLIWSRICSKLFKRSDISEYSESEANNFSDYGIIKCSNALRTSYKVYFSKMFVYKIF